MNYSYFIIEIRVCDIISVHITFVLIYRSPGINGPKPIGPRPTGTVPCPGSDPDQNLGPGILDHFGPSGPRTKRSVDPCRSPDMR